MYFFLKSLKSPVICLRALGYLIKSTNSKYSFYYSIKFYTILASLTASHNIKMLYI